MGEHLIKYRLRDDINIECGFVCKGNHILAAVLKTDDVISELPLSLFKSINFKTTSALIGSIFAEHLAFITGSIVNPIEKGHPDIIPISGSDSNEQELRNYPKGIEIKVTVGNIIQGKKLKAGDERIDFLTGITWQAHHREVSSLMGVIWDFIEYKNKKVPLITGIFFSVKLNAHDWGKISGLSGRNTKVTVMTASGKKKMGNGWILILDNKKYLSKYTRL